MKIKLGEQAKTEFIEHISKQSIKCWFDGDELIMPSGQGRASKGIVLYQLQVWQLKQAEIDEKDKRIAELEQFNQNQYLGMKDRALEIEELTKLIHKLLEDDNTYMRPSVAHECMVVTGWKCEPK